MDDSIARRHDQLTAKLVRSLHQAAKALEAKDRRIAELEGDRNNLLVALQQIFEGDYDMGEHIEIACKALDTWQSDE